MAIAESKVLEVKEAADIVDVISSFLPLRRAGVNFKTLCPFHEEKTPSFIVSPGRQTYHCFGCGSGGDVYTFLMAQERLDFPGVVRLLAERLGITVEEEQQDRSRLPLVDLASQFYRGCLRKSESGRLARSYLKGRGITEESARRFDLGYAPPTGRALVDLARKKGLSLATMEEAGLVLQRGSEWRDRFRHRLMFPIADERGRAIGFGGRILGEGEPKYLNSPEGPLFSKGKLLYAAHLAREEIRKAGRAVVVEGYTDVLRAHQEGQMGVVGCLGTAFTPRQASLLGRYSKKVVLVYDPDSAGVAASERGLDILLSQGLDVKVAHLPQGKDPFDFLAEEGGEAFQKVVDEAEDFFEFKLRAARSRHDLASSAGEAAAAGEVVATLKQVSDPIRKEILFRKAAEALGIREEVLRASSEAKPRRPRRSRTTPLPPRGGVLEETLLEILVNRPDLAGQTAETVPIETYSDRTRPVVEAIYQQLKEEGAVDVAKLFVRLKDERYCRVLVEAQEGDSPGKDFAKAWEDIQKRLRERQLDTQRVKLRDDLEKATRQGDQKSADRIFLELATCIREQKGIRG